jgi:hypothetical protein
MFDPCAHKANLCKQGEFNPSLSNNNKLSMWIDPLLECVAHIPKQTLIDWQEFRASTKVEFQGHLLTMYMTK